MWGLNNTLLNNQWVKDKNILKQKWKNNIPKTYGMQKKQY